MERLKWKPKEKSESDPTKKGENSDGCGSKENWMTFPPVELIVSPDNLENSEISANGSKNSLPTDQDQPPGQNTTTPTKNPRELRSQVRK